jgi:hypothetical protein
MRENSNTTTEKNPNTAGKNKIKERMKENRGKKGAFLTSHLAKTRKNCGTPRSDLAGMFGGFVNLPY